MVSIPVPAADQQKGRAFYESLLGQPFAHSHYSKEVHHHAPAASGVKVTIGPPQNAGQPIMAMFSVLSIDNSVARLTALGGKAQGGKFDIPVEQTYIAALNPEWQRLYSVPVGASMGKSQVMKDPFGNGIILIELEPWAATAFAAGDLSDRELGIHEVAMAVAEKTFGKEPHGADVASDAD